MNKDPICSKFDYTRRGSHICLENATKFYFDPIDNEIIPRCENHPLVNFKESSLEEYLAHEVLKS